MAGFVDIHSHLLPGIDDGPGEVGESVAMARAAVDAGTTTLAATPHLRPDFPDVHIEELAERAERLREELRQHEIPLDVVQGAEASLVWALEADEDALKRATFGGRGTDLLVETPGQVTMLQQLLYQLRVKSLRITLAHPERSPEFHRDREQLRALVDQGVLLQVNAESILGRSRSSARSLAEWLCREGLATAIASDGHRGTEWRPVVALGDAVRAAARWVGGERATWMASEAPAAILAGRPLPAAPDIDAAQPRRRFLGIAGRRVS